MTRERAKSELMQIYGFLSPDKQMALDVAIAALEQEPLWTENSKGERIALDKVGADKAVKILEILGE